MKPIVGVWDQWCVASDKPYIKMATLDDGTEIEQTSLLDAESCRQIVRNFGLSRTICPAHWGISIRLLTKPNTKRRPIVRWHIGAAGRSIPLRHMETSSDRQKRICRMPTMASDRRMGSMRFVRRSRTLARQSSQSAPFARQAPSLSWTVATNKTSQLVHRRWVWHGPMTRFERLRN